MSDIPKVGFYERLRALGYKDFKISKSEHSKYGIDGSIPCEEQGRDEFCWQQAFVRLDGSPYCIWHATWFAARREKWNAEDLENLRSALLSLGLKSMSVSDPSPNQCCGEKSDGGCKKQAVIVIITTPQCLQHGEAAVQHQRELNLECENRRCDERNRLKSLDNQQS